MQQLHTPAPPLIQFSSLGTTYRGRILISMRVEQRPPPKMGHCVIRKDMKYSLPTELIPATQKCILRVAAFQGSDIPIFRLPTGVAKMRIQVCIGSHKMMFKFRKNHKGVVEWNQVIIIMNILLLILRCSFCPRVHSQL